MKSEFERRASLTIGDRIWVAYGDLLVGTKGWLPATIASYDEDDTFYAKVDGAPEGLPPAKANRYSPNMRPFGLLELIADAAQ